MYFYVDTKEMLSDPKPGVQWTAWYIGRSQNNPGGSEFTDVIKGSEVRIRSMVEVDLVKFLKNAYKRAPWLRAYEVTE